MAKRKIKRFDPTRTATLRRMFVSAIKRRFRLIKGAIIKLIDDEDALGLKKDLINGLVSNAGQWKFESTPNKVKNFQTWIKKQFADKLHGADENRIWEHYIQQGFKKGAARAFEDVNKKMKAMAGVDPKKLQWYAGSKSQFLQSSFNNPVSIEKVKLLAGRTFTDLEGITQAMSTKISRTLTDGLVQGKSPRDIAKDLVDSVGIEEARASTMARTELIRAHAEGQLQALEEMGVAEVGVEVEWTITDDEKVCPECEAMAEVVLPIAEARGMIPRHPNAVFADSSFVPYGECQELVRSWYRGPSVVLTLGSRINCTTIGPNHPVMTRRGMIPAAQLTESDYVLCDNRKNWSPHSLDREKVPTIADVFTSLVCVTGDSGIVSSSSDLHGDREFCQGEVQAIRPARGLLTKWDSFSLEKLREIDFTGTHSQLEFGSSLGSKNLGFHRIDLASSPCMGEGCLFCRRVNSDFNPHAFQTKPDGTPIDLVPFFEGAQGLARQIEVPDFFKWERVHKVSFSTYEGWAFDASTDTSLYYSGGLVVSNCRCAWIPANVGEKSDTQKTGKAADKAIEVSFGADEDDDEGWGPVKNEEWKTKLDKVLTPISETIPKWKQLITNAFCPTGPGGGVDPTCSPGGGGGSYASGHELVGSLKSKTGLKVNAEFAQKIAWLNPNGVQNGTVVMPKKMSDTPEKIAQLQKVLPPGTVIKQVSFKPDTMQNMTPEQFAKQGKIISTAPKQASSPYEPPPNLPSGKGGLETITTLSGSTAPVLMKDPNTGQRWVVKSPGKGGEGHLKSEAEADAIYRAMGVDVPVSGFVGGVKMGAFLEGAETLNNWKSKNFGDKKAIQAMHKEISKNFVLDAVTANWDVVGMTQDNIMIKDGKPFRIDNGGALSYRAQGGLKGSAFTEEVKELQSMRDGTNPVTAAVYKGLNDKEVMGQIKDVMSNKMKILDQISDPGVRDIMSKRIDNLKEHYNKLAGKKSQGALKKEMKAALVAGFKVDPNGGKNIEFHGHNFQQAKSVPMNKVAEKMVPITPGDTIDLPTTDVFVSKKDHNAWKNSLTHSEKSAISSWKGSSTSIRNAMREQIKDGKEINGYPKAILTAIEKHAPQPGVYYRGLAKGSHFDPEKFATNAMKALDSGEGFLLDTLPAGMSTKPGIARKFSSGHVMTRIISKNARPIIKEDGFGNEAEVIQPPSSYKVRAVHKNVYISGHSSAVKYFIDLEEI